MFATAPRSVSLDRAQSTICSRIDVGESAQWCVRRREMSYRSFWGSANLPAHHLSTPASGAAAWGPEPFRIVAVRLRAATPDKFGRGSPTGQACLPECQGNSELDSTEEAGLTTSPRLSRPASPDYTCEKTFLFNLRFVTDVQLANPKAKKITW